MTAVTEPVRDDRLIRNIVMRDGTTQQRMTYSINTRITWHQAKELVENALTVRLIVVVDSGIREGMLQDLWAEFGDAILPINSEGIIHMAWRQQYKGTTLEDSITRRVDFVDPIDQVPGVSMSEYIYGEVTGPFAHMVRFYKGSHAESDPVISGRVTYVFCRDRAGDVVEVPLAVKVQFFGQHVQPLVGKLHEETTYRQGSFEYAAQYVDRHTNMLKKVLSGVPDHIRIVEPGCGYGIVGQFRSNVVCGDLHPPLGCLGIVRQERIMETFVRAGKEESVYLCAYIECFMTEEEKSFLIGKKVIWLDATMRSLPGREIFPGLHFENIPAKWEPTSFLQERTTQVAQLSYTENLLNGESYAIASENEYVRYLRAMRPHIKLELLPEYKGLFVSQIKRADRILATTIEEAIYYMGKGRRVYFAPVGKEIDAIFTEANLLCVNGDTQMYYEYRQLYRVPSNDQLLRAYFSHFASKVIGQYFYFYDYKDEGDMRQLKIRTPLLVLNGELLPKEGLRDIDQCTLSLVNGTRLYAEYGSIKIPLRWDASYSTLQYVLRSVFKHSISKDQMEQLLSLSDKVGGKINKTLREKLLYFAGTHRWVQYLKSQTT